jgi:integrase/recombinase XerD
MYSRTSDFKSILGEIIAGYIKEMRACGYKYIKGASLLKQFDTLAAKENLSEVKLPKKLVLLWTKKRPNETDSTINGRISTARRLARYMVRLGHKAFIYPAAAVKIARYSYIPYIFSKEELRKIFTVCDNYPVSRFSPNRHIILPLLLRMLYGCGLRISEALNLKVGDIDPVRGTLLIRDTKFKKERIVPMAETLTRCCRIYLDKIHKFSTPGTFFFPSPYGGSYKVSTAYKLFREVLWKAGISHSGKGPRLHDIRHSHAVGCLKRWVMDKKDITNLLPYLSAYLGHNDLRGTQHYLRLTADLYPDIINSVEDECSFLIPEVSNETD